MAANPIDLTTVAKVKAAQEGVVSTARDSLIQDGITAASGAIILRTERELTPQATATRRFPVPLEGWGGSEGVICDLAPYDLRTPNTVTLHPEASGSAIALTRDVDYTLEPVPAKHGGYYRLRLSRYLNLWSAFAFRFGHAQLDVTGDWGLYVGGDTNPTVPGPLERATILAVRSWLRQNPGGYQTPQPAGAGGSVQPPTPQTFALPLDTLNLIAPWQRWSVI